MPLSAHAAVIRGDDYHHLYAWTRACEALTNPDIISISVEDSAGGSFDDVVVRRRSAPDEYEQIKSSNADVIYIDDKWLTTAATPNGRSPLQHFHATWRGHRQETPKPRFRLLGCRGFDQQHPILNLRDPLNNRVTRLLAAKGPKSAAGKIRTQWAKHLAITETELVEFLDNVEFCYEGGESSWLRQGALAMRAAGLRDDPDAVILGRELVGEWVKTGTGPQTPDMIRKQVADTKLLSRQGTLVYAIHAIDRSPQYQLPTLTTDILDLYEGETDRERRQLRDPADWDNVVRPRLVQDVRTLESYGVRRVHITGDLRLALWFTVGAMLPDVRNWVISVDQRNVEWRSDAAPAAVEAPIIDRVVLDQGTDLAVAVGLTLKPTDEVVAYLREEQIPVSELLVLSSTEGPGQRAVPDAEYAVGWTHAARTAIRSAVADVSAKRVHLFFAAPKGVAVMLGHHWNLMPPTLVYEHLQPGYAPTTIIR